MEFDCPWAAAGGSSMQPSSPRLDPAPLWPLMSFLDVLAPTLLSSQVPVNWGTAFGVP